VRAAGLALLLLACKAEDLGVILPAGGPTSISHEDLQRDAALFGRADAGPAWARRLADMHLHPVGPGGASLPGEPSLACGRKDGRGPGAPLVLLAPAGCPAAAAAAISLAKGWDTVERPPRGVLVCWGEGSAAEVRGRLGLPPGAPVLRIGDASVGGAWCASGGADEGDLGPCAGARTACGAPAGVDWRAVEAALEGAHAALGPALQDGTLLPLTGWRSGGGPPG
jgi:hypothetical protein